MRRAVYFLVLVLLTGCTLDTVRSKPLDAQAKAPGNPNVGAPETLTYHPSLNVDLAMMARTPSGLYWKDITVGTGAEAVRGRRRPITPAGFRWAGIDSSKKAGKPYSFLWDGAVIRDGTRPAGMRVGGVGSLIPRAGVWRQQPADHTRNATGIRD
jgi:hypothetical protein